MEKLKVIGKGSGSSDCCGTDCCKSAANNDHVLLNLPYNIPLKVFYKLISRKEKQNEISR
jgi:hypothetical protein